MIEQDRIAALDSQMTLLLFGCICLWLWLWLLTFSRSDRPARRERVLVLHVNNGEDAYPSPLSRESPEH